MASRVTFAVDGNEVVVLTTAENFQGGIKLYEDRIPITQAMSEGQRSGSLLEADLLRQIRAAYQVIDERITADMTGNLLELAGDRDYVRNLINNL